MLPIQTTESKWKYKEGGPLSKANVKDQGVSDTGDHNSTTKVCNGVGIQGGFEQGSQELAKSTILTQLITIGRLLECN